MSIEYKRAPEVEEIANELIAKHHTHLVNERIEYVFRSTVQKQGGKEIWGKARKISGLNAFLSRSLRDTEMTIEAGDNVVAFDPSEDYFVIEIAGDVWKFLKPEARVALVDHELTHCGVDWDDEGKKRLVLYPHDLEEFAEVVRRHGLWRQDIKAFFHVAQQLKLVEDEPEAASK